MRICPLHLILGLSMALVGTPSFTGERNVAAKVSDLAWMSGRWEGVAGKDDTVLEENWTQPKGGTIAAFVRAVKGNVTTTLELVVIEEVEGSLVLHLQQWEPGYKPRLQGALVMKLTEIGKNEVMFQAVGDSPFMTLEYRREGARFTISATTAQGTLEATLSRPVIKSAAVSFR